MSHGWRMLLLAMIATAGPLGPAKAWGDLVVSPVGGLTGSNGDVNILPSSPNVSITYGADGQGAVYQMDGYVNVPGVTYTNPGDPSFGPSADLANGAPTGLTYTFAASQPSADQLLLSYQFTNISGAALAGFQFLQYTDPDVGSGLGESATVNGASSLGLAGNPSSFEVSDASYGPTFSNLANGTLTNQNDLTSSNPGDVSFALGFSVGTLAAGQTVTIDVLVSDDGSSVSPFSITEVAPGDPGDALTISGYIVPEPSSLVLLATGCLLGSVTLARVRPGRDPSKNPSSSGRCSSN
jgi:hypothetical protein